MKCKTLVVNCKVYNADGTCLTCSDGFSGTDCKTIANCAT